MDFKCIGIAFAATCTAANNGDLKGGRTGNSFFMCDAGAVEDGKEATRLAWQGDAPKLTDPKFLPFAGQDCNGGDDKELFALKTNHSAEECMTACKARTTCAGFNYNFRDSSSTYQRCVGKKKDGCSLVGGREGMAYYADVNVYTTTAAPDGSLPDGSPSGLTASSALPLGATNIVAIAVAMLLTAVQL
ncbi:unnamed protein product [Polarella glacialis]|uniref:Apple domain-containing protein n=1 Tax=Polarella glacialis TaxID=89957 RepID=A0A813DX65_POLGL|nr:unnamed protein product [Polarella glacialis]